MIRRIAIPVLIVSAASARIALAEPQHALALHGAPALSPDFESLPYANPDAPRGGSITYGARGRFDTLNPFTIKGRAPWIVRTHMFESLMARSWDESFTVYGFLAETVETDSERSWVEFSLRPEAKFSNGDPVTVDDVSFSLQVLRDHGRPNFRSYYSRVRSIEKPGTRRIRFTFDRPDRELPLLLGLMPVLSRRDWEGKDFTRTTMTAPIGSGPYQVSSIVPGETITLERRADYWGDSLPVNRGLHNFRTIATLYFRDDNALWEAFKAGVVRFRQETDPKRWQDGYSFPAAEQGEVVRGEIAHGRATGMYGFVFNTRRRVFSDRRVREALTLAFDFEWANTALSRGALKRITSYYANSELGFSGPATGRERGMLTPFEDILSPGTLDAGYTPPISPGTGHNRANLRRAARILRDAGWKVTDGRLLDDSGSQMAFEILLAAHEHEKIAAAFAESLKRLGISVSIRFAESAQYQARLTTYDYDMIVHRWRLSLAPGAEQSFYFGSDGVDRQGTRNYMGADHPAIDAMIENMLEAQDLNEYKAAVRALDRVLTSERYVIPLGYLPVERLAWWLPLSKPQRDPLYGYRPEVWWSGSFTEDTENIPKLLK